MKNQKTIIGMLLVLVLMLSFALTACGGNETPTTTLKPSTTTQPGDKLEISVVPAEVEFFAGDEFTILMGVTANLADAKVRVSDDGGFDAETPGTYTITYEATLGDQKVTGTRTVIVKEALSDLTLQVVKNHMAAGKWEGVFMNFKNAQYHALTADFTSEEALTGVFHNTSDKDIVVSISGAYGSAAISTANGVVIEGRDGANGRLVNAEHPIRVGAPQGATINVDGEDVLVRDNFAKVMTVPAGGFAIVVQNGAFGTGYDFDGRGFMDQSVLYQIGNVIRLFWADTEEDLTTYVNQKPVVSGNNKVLAVLSDPSFNLEEAVLAGLNATDDNGTFLGDDDVAIEVFTIVNNGGFDINQPGEYTVKLSVTDGELTTEFTRVVEVKADGVGILKIGENKFYVDMTRVKFNEEVTKAGNLAFLIYTKAFTGTLLENGWGCAFVLDEYGKIVRIYDGSSAKYYDAENPDGIKDSSKVTDKGYMKEAFASLQEGETLLVALNNGDNLHRTFAINNKVVGAKVSGLDMEFKVTDMTITINGIELTAPEGKWLHNVEVSTSTAAKYQMIIFDKNYTGTFTTNGWGIAIVLDQYGTLVKIYDGAWNRFFNVNGQDKDVKVDANNYAVTAWNELQDGETLIIFANDGGANLGRAFAKQLADNNLVGHTATLSGFKFAEKPVTHKTITINGKEFTAEEGKWAYNIEVTEKTAASYSMIIYDKNYTGTFTTNGWGIAIVLDQYGKLVKIYDGAWNRFFNVNGRDMDVKVDANKYAVTAWNELQEGETLIIFPNDGGTNAARTYAKDLADSNEMGKVATLTGFTFKQKEA